jgi:hypothetical protein
MTTINAASQTSTKEVMERDAGSFKRWANENPMTAMMFALSPTAGWAGYSMYRYPSMRMGERFARSGMAGQAAVLASLLGAVSVFWVWETPEKQGATKH